MAKSKQLPGQLDLFDISYLTQQNDSTKRVKTIKVSPAMWELLKERTIDMSTLPDSPKELNGYIGRWDGVTIVVDDDVALYKLEYEGERQ